MADPTRISELEQLRDAITARLAGLAVLNGATVISRKIGNLQNAIERGLQKDGCLVIVNIPQAKTQPRQSARPVLDPVSVVIRCIENVLLNKTGPSAAYTAERVLAALQWWKPAAGDVPGGDLLKPVDPAIRQILIPQNDPNREGDEEPDYDAWDVLFETRLALQPIS